VILSELERRSYFCSPKCRPQTPGSRSSRHTPRLPEAALGATVNAAEAPWLSFGEVRLSQVRTRNISNDDGKGSACVGA
jgi:hypothetical protein